MSIQHLNGDNFEKVINESGKTVLVDFWADWCMPCKMFSPILEKAAEECGDNAVIGKLNIDEEAELATRYNVMSIPTVVVFRDGKEITRSVGAISKAEVLKLIEE